MSKKAPFKKYPAAKPAGSITPAPHIASAPDISLMTYDEIQKLVVEMNASIIKLACSTGTATKPGPHTAPWRIGANYLIRTVTMIDTGRLVDVTPTELVLEDAAWIADTGRFSGAVSKASFGEVEPFPAGRVIIGRGAVIDAVEIHTVPRSQK
jgi:hypothetical protein